VGLVHVLKSEIRQVPLFTSGGLGLGLKNLVLFTTLIQARNVYNTSKLSTCLELNLQEAQLMLTTGSTRLAVSRLSRGQQTWYHSTCYI